MKYIRKSGSKKTMYLLAFATTIALSVPEAMANENKFARTKEADGTKAGVSAADSAGARVRPGRFLTSPLQLTPEVRKILQLPDGDIDSAGGGGANHPFTTKRASAKDSLTPVDKFPWSATGKLFMNFGSDTFVCTASVIRKGLLVTAAHCVHNFGDEDAGFADAVSFEPARHEGARPFGTWVATEWWIPKVYWDGSDICSAQAPGVVCENDIAVVVIEKRDGDHVGDLTGKYGFKDKSYSFFPFLGQQAAQITQLGYPSENYVGDKMIRTDSLGYQEAPKNVIWGSNQTGGSSGGPQLVNFGMPTSFTGPPAKHDESNQVISTTSWGYTSGTVKVQGGSRFSRNTAYTVKSNIQSLVDSACGANPDNC